MSTDHNFWRERRAEADSNPNRSPSAYQPNHLTAGPHRLSIHCKLGGEILTGSGDSSVVSRSRVTRVAVTVWPADTWPCFLSGLRQKAQSSVTAGRTVTLGPFDLVPPETRAWTSLKLVPEMKEKRRYVQHGGVRPLTHTPSIAFRHLPPNSARFSYATEGALFISAQLSTDTVSALQKVRVLIRLEAT